MVKDSVEGGSPRGSEDDSKVLAHLLSAIGFAFLVGLRVVFARADAEEPSARTLLLFTIWGLASYLVHTTPAFQSVSNAAIALVITLLGLATNSGIGLFLLPVLWWRARSARILAQIVADDARGKAAAAQKASRSEPKPAAEKKAPTGGFTPEQMAAIGRLTALAATHGSLLDSKNLFPYINEPSFGNEAQTASERLVATWNASPIVTLGHDGGLAIAWAGRAELNEDNKRIALENLRARPERADWEKHSVAMAGGKAEIFARMGGDLTASDLVDPEFLQQAYERCKSKVVFFAIPTREAMVMASHPDPVAHMAQAAFEDGESGQHPIAPCIFAFSGEGALVPMIPQIG